MEEQVYFPCPCGTAVKATFVLPTDRGRYAIFGSCEGCKARGVNPTTIAYLKPENTSELSLFKRFAETSLLHYREAA